MLHNAFSNFADMEKQGKIDELKFDEKNFNRHTEFGMSTLERSLREFGAGRSVLVDKDNNIIAGNGIVETAANIGITKTRIVETDGTELVVVRRKDVELDSKQGRGMALADNATAAADLEWDTDAIQQAVEDFDIDLSNWGLDFKAVDVTPAPQTESYDITVTCANEDEKTETMEFLKSAGYECR